MRMMDKLENYIPEPNTGCWLWLGLLDKDGYGRVYDASGKHVFAHRLFYSYFIGEIPDDLTIDHKCFLPCCVNPEHLCLATHNENARRQRSSLKTHCVNGHEFTPENTIIRKNGTSRCCRLCGQLAQREYYQRKKLNFKRVGKRWVKVSEIQEAA